MEKKGYFPIQIEFEKETCLELYAKSQRKQREWEEILRERTQVRRIEDFYSFRGEIGRGRFGVVFKVSGRGR